MITKTKYSEEEQVIIRETIENYMETIGCAEFMIRMRPYKMSILKWSSLVMLLLIVFIGIPLWTFFLPLLPIVLINIVYIVDLNIIVYSMNKAHTELIRGGITIDWEELMDFVYEYLCSKIKTQDDEQF